MRHRLTVSSLLSPNGKAGAAPPPWVVVPRCAPDSKFLSDTGLSRRKLPAETRPAGRRSAAPGGIPSAFAVQAGPISASSGVRPLLRGEVRSRLQLLPAARTHFPSHASLASAGAKISPCALGCARKTALRAALRTRPSAPGLILAAPAARTHYFSGVSIRSVSFCTAHSWVWCSAGIRSSSFLIESIKCSAICGAVEKPAYGILIIFQVSAQSPLRM